MDESSMQLDYEEDSTLELDGSSISNKPMDNLKISIDNEIDPDLTVTFLKLEADKDKELDDSPEEGPQVKLAPIDGLTKNKYITYQVSERTALCILSHIVW